MINEISLILKSMIVKGNIALASTTLSKKTKFEIVQIIDDSLDMVNRELGPLKLNQLTYKLFNSKRNKK